MNDIFHISKLLIKKRLKVLTASDELKLKKFNKEYPFLKEIRIEELAHKIDGGSTINKAKAWQSIETKFQYSREKSVFKLYKKTWYKYTAAAMVIAILTATYFFKDTIFSSPLESTPKIVNTQTKSIAPGTDKATLTLANGSVVILEKGNGYNAENVSSNGEEIVYKRENKKSTEIAYNFLTIPRGGQFYLKLSDGTEVWLNSESQLKYPVAFDDNETRVVELIYGEAFFDVSPSIKHSGSKFKVLNHSQKVEVLGTIFNIKAYKDETDIYTTLVEGKVVIDNGISKQTLLPNEQSKLNILNNRITIGKVDTSIETSWKKGIFSFKNKPLKDIMKVISRWYDVDVLFKNKDLELLKFTGVLDKQQSIEEVLLILKSNTINKYEILNKTIILE